MLKMHIISNNKAVYVEEVNTSLTNKSEEKCCMKVDDVGCENIVHAYLKGPLAATYVCSHHLLDVLSKIGSYYYDEEYENDEKSENSFKRFFEEVRELVEKYN